MDWFSNIFATVQQWLFEGFVQPVAFAVGAGNLLEDGYTATGWLVVGLLQIVVMVLVIGPAQRLWPVEAVTDRHAIRVDVIYTLLHRLGLFKLAMFFTFDEWATQFFGFLRAKGLPTLQIDQLWPGVTDIAWVSFLLYLVVFDALGYWVHRFQHQFHWWWQLHSVHHSQRQMTMWTDNRNHLLDSVIVDMVFVTVALLVGVGPSQFVALVALSQLFESLQHANLRWRWPNWVERIAVSPRFHRRHHEVTLGHEPGITTSHPYGANFGILFSCWDMLFKSAEWKGGLQPTGIQDQVESGRDYGRGFWAQQWLGLVRLFQRGRNASG
ncbi:sterol desaturase family protein [Ottowia thiooxydans]|uniref:sterol desaturase family protein n=1 Tax=Ottowia thiooxydans TaxID=219182 RepID=UPI00040251E2|nr:sterol desaturase family protein [Ottowia thiooxydans]